MTFPVADIPQSLYRFYDTNGRLLYIGITMDLGGRWGSHNRDKPWWRSVARATIEHHPNREAVLAAERAAIIAEKPAYNVIHNQGAGRARRDQFEPKTPAGSGMWQFTNRESGYTRTVPLWLYWEVEGDPLSDNYDLDDLDAVEMWNEWRRQYPPDADEFFGPTTKRIWWYIDGGGVCESAPGQDLRGSRYVPEDDFLTWYTWPVNPQTGELLQWLRLPVVDKLWRTARARGTTTKGGFIQEATGWKPSPLQPFVDVAQLEQMSRL